MIRRRVHIVIGGRVQGVCFRQSAQQTAHALALHGWVRNLESGEVESIAEGDAEAVEGFLDFCRQGPPAAQVERCHVQDVAIESPLPSPFAVERD